MAVASRSALDDGTPCWWKFRYHKRKMAASVAAAKRRETGEHITPYHCETHHCWHIGHTPRVHRLR